MAHRDNLRAYVAAVTGTTPTDPFAAVSPPPVVASYRAPDGRAELTLHTPVWQEVSRRTCLGRNFRAGARFLAPHRHEATEAVHLVREGTIR